MQRPIALLVLALAGCASRPDVSGIANIPDEAHTGSYEVRGDRLVLELRRGNELLDRVTTRLAKPEHTCINPGDHFATFTEDQSHAHPVRRAWRFDLGAGKIVAADPAGVPCVAVCPDDEP